MYLVHDPRTGNRYALKKTLCQTPEALAAATKELDILKSFRHDNILSVVDSGMRPGHAGPDTHEVLCVLPFYRRGTLLDVLEKRSYSEEHVLRIFLAVCEAVRMFHTKDPPLSHNDIKPGNVLMSDHEVPVLMDFGSVAPARHMITSRRDALVLKEFADSHCTPLYKAPELFDPMTDTTVDERTDVWALGCTLYQMAAKRSPFEDEAATGSIALAVQRGHIDFPPATSKQFSSDFQDLVRWILEPDHQQRPFIDDVVAETSKLLESSQTRNHVSAV